MFFDDWSGLIRVAVVGLLAYVGLVVLLRVSGKRTLSKLNAFDLVVTVALGSVLANVILNESTPLAEGVLGFAVLIGAQHLIAFLSVRSGRVRGLVKAEPALLLYRGEFLHATMKRERVTEDEVLAVIRGSGIGSVDGVHAVVLETDASLHVLPGDAGPDASSLRSVQGTAEVRRASRGD